MSVFVLDQNQRPLMPCSPKRARKLLESGRARVHKLYPFCIRLIDRKVCDSALQPMRLALDPGSKATGLALSRVEPQIDTDTGEINAPVMHIAFLMELTHRGQQIRDALHSRKALRRGRRSRNLRYRAPRFLNRAKPEGWLAPILRHRIETACSWVNRLRKLTPITHLAQELVRFDLQQLQNPEIEGAEYQQGTLFGYEVREYLLEKWKRQCSYCDKKGVPMQIEHLTPKARGGSNRVSNMTLACECCNLKKGAMDVREFVKDPARLKRLLAQAKAPLKDAAAVNATRWALANALKDTGLPLELASGGRTKFNRTRQGIPKTHALDAACVGDVADVIRPAQPVLAVKCIGRGSYCRTNVNASGFPRGYLSRIKRVHGFQTGDMVRAVVAKGKKTGIHVGRVAVRSRGVFNIRTCRDLIQDINHKYCSLIQRADGYGYSSWNHAKVP